MKSVGSMSSTARISSLVRGRPSMRHRSGEVASKSSIELIPSPQQHLDRVYAPGGHGVGQALDQFGRTSWRGRGGVCPASVSR